MAHIKRRLGLRVVALAAVVGLVAIGAGQALASGPPIVIPYEKTCNETIGLCEGSAGDGGTIVMQVTGFRATGKGAQLTVTEVITLGGGGSFTAQLSGHVSPAGFIVLNGTVTAGSFAGAQVHQRSNFVGLEGGNPSMTMWIGELQLMASS